MARSWACCGSGRREGWCGFSNGEEEEEEERGVGGVRAVRSVDVGARRRIFFELRASSARGGNGCRRRPVLGVMRSFWCVVGIERWVERWAERSVRVDSWGRVIWCGVPWWVIVRVMVGVEDGDSGGVEDESVILTVKWFLPVDGFQGKVHVEKEVCG